MQGVSTSTDRSHSARVPGTVPPLTSSPLLEGPRSGGRQQLIYLRHVLVHPYNLLFLGTFLLASLMGTSLWILLWTLLVETVVLGLLPRTRWVRRNVEDQLRSRERTEAGQVRAALAAHMDPARRQELVELERRVETIRANARRQGRANDPLLEEFLGLDRLLGSFVRLAVVHRATRESLSMTDRDGLLHEIELLDNRRRAAKSKQLERAVARQLGLARRRLQCFERNQQRLDAMEHHLGAIAEMIRLVHDQSLTLLDSERATDMVDRVLRELEDHEHALDELISVCVTHGVDDEVSLEELNEREEVRAIRVAAVP